MMKSKYYSIFCLFCLSVFSVSCGEKSEPEPEPQPDTKIVPASLSLSIDGDSWARKETVSMFSKDLQCSSPFSASDSGTEVVFNGERRACDVLIHALYPYDRDASISDGHIRTRLQTTQDGSAGHGIVFGSGSESAGMKMKRISSVLSFNILENSGISSVTVSCESAFLSGKLEIDCGTSGITPVSSNASHYVTLSGLDGQTAGTYSLNVIPSSSETELIIVFNDDASTKRTVKCHGGFPSGTVSDLGDFSIIAEYHPCLFLFKDEESKIERLISSSYDMNLLHSKIIRQAEASIAKVPSEYKLAEGGKRLLYVCRATMSYLFSLSYAYRMTGDSRYLDAAVTELDAVCSFPDWHPSHYLDVGEMCAAVSLAYDWLYGSLPEKTRKLAEKAIENYALDTFLSSKYNSGWYNANNNRNQVNCAGLYMGAMALKHICPTKCENVKKYTSYSIRTAVDGYDPDGAYPEGTGYWSYGTSFNALINYAQETTGVTPYYGNGGFRKTADYFLHAKGPSGEVYNYSDGGLECDVDMAPFYFAQLNKDCGLLWWELKAVSTEFSQTNRLMMMIMPFMKDTDLTSVPAPSSRTWHGDGTTPYYSARTSWTDPDASWLGIKGGLAYSSHSHMDGGSFVFESLGERWVIDLGGESYTSLENHGIDQGNLSQNSPRWDVQKYRTSSHSSMRLGQERLNVKGQATISSVIDGDSSHGVVMELTPLYYDVSSASRKAVLSDSGILTITDAVSPKNDVKYWFTMPVAKTTEIEQTASGRIRMKRAGKYVDVVISSGDLVFDTVLRNIKADNDYESADAKAVDFVTTLPGGKNTEIHIRFVPEGSEEEKQDRNSDFSDYGREDFNNW